MGRSSNGRRVSQADGACACVAWAGLGERAMVFVGAFFFFARRQLPSNLAGGMGKDLL